MKKLLAAMFAALLMVGCGEEAQWEANPEPYGGLKILAEIKEAKESGGTEMTLFDKKITDLADPNEAARNSNARKLLHEAMVSDARSYGGKSNRSLPRRRSSGRWISGWRRSDGRRGCTGQCRGQGG